MSNLDLSHLPDGIVIAAAGKPLGVAVGTSAAVVTGGTALAGSSIPIASGIGAAAAHVGTAALGTTAAAANAVGATTVGGAITAVGGNAAVVGTLLAPFVAPIFLTGLLGAGLWWLLDD